MAKAKGPRQLGLWIPQKVLGMDFLNSGEKIFYAYIYSFGGRGCWANNDQIGKALGRKPRTVRLHLTGIVKAGLVIVQSPNSIARRIWAKDHPAVKANLKRLAAQKPTATEKPKPGIKLPSTNKQDKEPKPGRIVPSTRHKTATLPGRIVPSTNTYTKKDTIKQNGGLALPAEGQPNAPLTKQERLKLHGAKESLTGFGSVKPEPRMSAADKATKAKKMLEQLKATEELRTLNSEKNSEVLLPAV